MTRTFILLLSIAIATGALMVTMGPAPASAQVTVVRDCGDHYVVTHYNSDGSVNGVHKKQLSDQGTIYTAGKTWKLVEGNPDRFVSDGGAQLLVVACDATPGKGARGLGGVQQDGPQAAQSSSTLVSNLTSSTTIVTVDEPATSEFATSFTTGTNSLGYTLTRVRMGLNPTSAVSKYSVSIHANSSGIPGATLGTLESGAVPTGLRNVDFPASGAGIQLAADTTYWLVTSVNGSVKVFTTTEDGESGDSLPGWDVGGDRLSNSPNWNTSNTLALGFTVFGYVKTFADTKLPDNFDCNTYLGWEHTNGRQWDSADRVWRQVGSYYYGGQYANTGEPICERRFSSVGPGSYADKLGYGMTLCSLAPTWQTVDPETGEAVGGSAEKHYTGHKTSSGQDICSDFDGLRSTKKYRQEQQLKQYCMRAQSNDPLCN